METGIRVKRAIMGRLPHGVDMLEALTQKCKDEGVKLGEVRGIGAAENARVGIFDLKKKEYHYVERDEGQEILALVGNISTKDGEPFVHAHITYGDHTGNAWGGHLAEGNVVYVLEYVIYQYEGDAALEREFIPELGLLLWPPK